VRPASVTRCARIVLHQPWGSTGQGQSIDIKIRAEEMLRQRRLMEKILARHTGQREEKLHEDLDRDFILSPEEALAYGVVDVVG
jgi:ATP-dependent Clp protease, protease subunit